MKYASDFNPTGLKVLLTKSDTDLVAAYTCEFKGVEYFHIRALWKDDRDNWKPGKGVSVKANQAAELCAALADLSKPQSNGN